MATIDNHRWSAGPDQFAATVHLDDVPGFFSKQLIIEPGTRALIVDQGRAVGEVGPGSYTLESFAARLSFWRRKQATVVVTRQEDFPVEVTCTGLPTAENLAVDATVRLMVQIEDVALFARNLLGTREGYSIAELREAVTPLVRQALWDAVGRLSITELTGPDARDQIDAAVEQAVGLAMRRYGLRFVAIQLVGIRHEKFDEHRRGQGAIWLQREGLKQQQDLHTLYSDEELEAIKHFERENQLAVLAENVAVDGEAADLGTELRRMGVRKELRAAVQSEEFDKVRTDQELQNFLHQRDKQRVLRAEEKEDLVAAYQQRKTERAQARAHLLAKLDLEQRMDMELVREKLDHSIKRQRLDHEIELARHTAVKENDEWRRSLVRERDEAEHRRQLRDAELHKQREWTRQEAGSRREQEWEEIVHRQKVDRVQGELQQAQTERNSRLARLESELKSSLAADQLDTQRRRKDWELEVAQKESSSQLERMEAVQRINHEAARRQQELQERQLRLTAELDELKSDRTSARDIARLQTMKTMTTEALVATAQLENAALLVDLKKHESSQEMLKTQAALQSNAATAADQAKFHQELTAAERSKADAVAAALREAMQLQQKASEQALNAMREVAAKSQQPQIATVAMPGVAYHGTLPGGATVLPAVATNSMPPAATATPTSPPANAKRVDICPSCRAENAETARHCSACGTQI